MKFEKIPKRERKEEPQLEKLDINSGDIETDLDNMFESDQSDRKEGLSSQNKELYLERERQRKERAEEIYSQYDDGTLELKSPDLGRLGMIFQHGDKPADYKRAFELAKKSAETGTDRAKWLQAAAEDRYLISIGEKQKWGTQFEKTDEGWKYHGEMADDSESGITDEMRQEMGVPPKSQQFSKIAEKYPDKTELAKESSKGHAHLREYSDVTYDVYKLIHLSESMPLKNIRIKDFETQMKEKLWRDKNGRKLSPDEIVSALEINDGQPDWQKLKEEHPEWADEIRKIARADYIKHPILVIENEVLDGAHRLTKAWIDNVGEIGVKKFHKLPEDAALSKKEVERLRPEHKD